MLIPQKTPWQIVRRSKLELATGAAFGLLMLATGKYLCAAFLVFWLLAGGN